jgi:hypothetical protein
MRDVRARHLGLPMTRGPWLPNLGVDIRAETPHLVIPVDAIRSVLHHAIPRGQLWDDRRVTRI